MDERQVHVVEIRAPIAAVWAEITKLKHPQRPMFNTVLETDFQPGSRILYRSQDGKRIFILGEVLELLPPNRFVHTFRFTNLGEAPTLVEWQLQEAGGVTRVTVTHSRFVDQKRTADSVRTSWADILASLQAVVETGTVPLKTRIAHRLMATFMFLAPRATLRENIEELRERRS